jgi:copper chaperone
MKLAVPDMSCGHCKTAVERAIQSTDPSAAVRIDLAARTAEVKSIAPRELILAALAAEGYPATPAA